MPSLLPNDTRRLFIAVDLPNENWAAVQRIQDQLRDTHADVRWVEERNLHLTLQFLGEVPELRVWLIRDALYEIGEAFSPFSLTLRGVGAFPNVRQPKTIWSGIAGNSDPLQKLARAVEVTMSGFGYASDKPFRPHLTLGRVRGSRGGQALTSELLRLKEEPITVFSVEGFTLYQSDLRPQGPIYTALAHYPLSSP